MKPFLLYLLIGSAALGTGQAQNSTQQVSKLTDEAIIRELIDRDNKGDKDAIRSTKNGIFVSGAMDRPAIKSDESEGTKKDNEAAMAERLNYVTKTDIQRLVVAQAGDMAYEYSRGNLSWNNTTGRKISFEVSYLRVWLKTEGKWKVDAEFVRPDGR